MSQDASEMDRLILDEARAGILRTAAALTALAGQLDTSFSSIARDILAISGKVITTGTGTSGIIAERLAHLLAVAGTPAFYLPCLDALHGGIGAIESDDYVIAISKGGQSRELIELTTCLVERGHRVLAVTENPASPFARAATTVAHIATEPKDADIGGLIATGSTLVAGAWGDALTSILMRLRGHGWQEVIDSHPGGIVGQQTDLPADVTLGSEAPS